MSISAVFRYYDQNDDGQLSSDEFATIFKQLNPKGYEDDELRAVFDLIDTDKSGRIEYREFIAWCFGDSAGQRVIDEVTGGAVEVTGHPRSPFPYENFGIFRGPVTTAELKQSLTPHLKGLVDPGDVEIVTREKTKIKVTLDQRDGKVHGMKYKKTRIKNKNCLEILEAQEALVKEWNANHPQHAVHRGDIILTVNDTSKDFDGAMSGKNNLEFLIQKTLGQYSETVLDDSVMVGGEPGVSTLVYLRHQASKARPVTSMGTSRS